MWRPQLVAPQDIREQAPSAVRLLMDSPPDTTLMAGLHSSVPAHGSFEPHAPEAMRNRPIGNQNMTGMSQHTAVCRPERGVLAMHARRCKEQTAAGPPNRVFSPENSQYPSALMTCARNDRPRVFADFELSERPSITSPRRIAR